MIEFHVPGAAAPQGSKRPIKLRNGRVVLLESSARVKPYRAVVALAARQAWSGPPAAGEVTLDVAFTFLRPKSHLTRSGAVRAGAPAAPGRPDLDKLLRAVGDALTGIVYADDSQVTGLIATKAYGTSSGTRIRVWAADIG